MNFLKKSTLLSIFTQMVLSAFFVGMLLSCATMQYGEEQSDFSFEDATGDKAFKEIVIPYKTFINGIPVKGDEPHILGSAASPDGESLFTIVSFPKLSIIKTDNDGKTFTSTSFDSGYFSYDDNNEDTTDRPHRSFRRNDIHMHAIFDGEKVALSIGPFVFISGDRGNTWKRYTPFFNLDQSFVRKLLIGDNGALYAFTDTDFAYSLQWGKKWIKVKSDAGTIKNKNIQLVDALFYNKMLYVSVIDKSVPLPALYQAEHEYLYSNKKQNGSGVFTCDPATKKYIPTGIDAALLFIGTAEGLYGQSIFNYQFTANPLDEKFKQTLFYQTGSLKGGKNSLKYYAETVAVPFLADPSTLYNGTGELYQIGTATLQKAEMTDALSALTIQAMNNADIFYFINAGENKGKKEPFQFSYSYDPLQFIYTVNQGYMNNLFLCIKGGDGAFYRIVPTENYLRKFIGEALTWQYTYDNNNPFLRKSSDSLPINPDEIAKIFPFKVEKLVNGTWQELITSKELAAGIMPEEKTKSGYWYRAIEKKKKFKLEFVLGSNEKNDMLYYPSNLMWYRDGIVIEINNYKKEYSYHELYKIKKD